MKTVTTITEKTEEKSGMCFNGFENINSLDLNAPNSIIVGTVDNSEDSTGYYQINMADISNIQWTDDNFSEANNYTSSEVSKTSLNGFYYDETFSRLFAFTSNEGVWLNILNDDGERIWTHE